MCNCTNSYVAPVDYNPSINSNNYDLNLAKDVFNTCQTILNKSSYYLSASKELQGYSWINFPMRIWNFVANWWTKGKIERESVEKISEAFNFILNINTESVLSCSDEQYFRNTRYHHSMKFFVLYTTLAEKVIKKYSKYQYPKLYELAHRILHERADYVNVPAKEVNLGSGERRPTVMRVKNILGNVVNTPYEKTTLWKTD